MALAIFDLDNTLIAGDSDHAWGQYLVEEGIVDSEQFKRANDQFYQDYLDGCLDMNKYLEFSLAPLSQHPMDKLQNLRKDFVQTRIKPLMLEKSEALIKHHKAQGDFILIITATNRFVTEPIAELLEVDDLIATEPELIDNVYTGKVSGIPSFQEGKVTRLQHWLKTEPHTLESAYFYSDSHNDLPLLELVTYPIAVDPDDKLANIATERGWKLISLR